MSDSDSDSLDDVVDNESLTHEKIDINKVRTFLGSLGIDEGKLRQRYEMAYKSGPSALKKLHEEIHNSVRNYTFKKNNLNEAYASSQDYEE